MTRARTIVLGAAHWHVPLYVQAMAQVHDVVGIADENKAAALSRAEVFGLEVTTNWRDLIDLPGIELAYVFGPHNQMPTVCHALIERGIPFVVEKPAGTSLADLTGIRQAAEAAGVPATVPLMQRGGPTDTWLARAGRPIYQRLSFVAGPPQRYLANGSPWMLDPAVAGGGCLANLGPHFIDLFLQRSGHRQATQISSLLRTLHGGRVEDHATVILTTADGREAIIEVGYAFPGSALKRSCSYTSVGDLGYAEITSHGEATFTNVAGHSDQATLDVDSDPLYGPFVRRVAAGLPGGFAGMPTLRELEDTMRVIWDAYEAHGRGNTWPI